MGNVVTSGVNGRRRQGSRRSHPPPPPPAPPQPEISANRYVFAAATPYPSQYPNPNHPPHPYYQYPAYYAPPPPAMPMPLPAPYDHHHRGTGGPHPHPNLDQAQAQAQANWVGGRYPSGPVIPAQTPYIEHQKAVTIRNDVNLKKETLRIEQDEENPGRFLVSFTFDATVACRYRSSFSPIFPVAKLKCCCINFGIGCVPCIRGILVILGAENVGILSLGTEGSPV